MLGDENRSRVERGGEIKNIEMPPQLNYRRECFTPPYYGDDTIKKNTGARAHGGLRLPHHHPPGPCSATKRPDPGAHERHPQRGCESRAVFAGAHVRGDADADAVCVCFLISIARAYEPVDQFKDVRLSGGGKAKASRRGPELEKWVKLSKRNRTK